MPVPVESIATESLVDPAQVASFPGAPFSEEALATASVEIRSEADWHIAPEVTETVAVDSEGGRFLFLPTMRLVSVTAVRNISTDTPSAATGFRTAKTLRFRAGVVENPYGWPCGQLEVDMVHGYDTCPSDLARVVAARAHATSIDTSQGSVRLGSLSITPSSGANNGSDATLARYRLPSAP